MKNALIGIEWEPQVTLLEYPNLPVDFRSGYAEAILIPFIKIITGRKAIQILIREIVFTNYALIKLPKPHFFLSTDNVKHNVEVRTYPVPLSHLQGQISLCNNYLGTFINQLKPYTSKGIGVFLPKASLNDFSGISYMDINDRYQFLDCHTPSKHVSISFTDEMGHGTTCCRRLSDVEGLARLLSTSKEYEELKHFRSFIKVRMSTIDYNSRVHMMVPYNFTDYKKLIPLTRKLWQSDVSTWLSNYIALARFINDWYKNNEPSGPKLIGYIKKGEYINVGGLV
jgi:hypothetical protein